MCNWIHTIFDLDVYQLNFIAFKLPKKKKIKTEFAICNLTKFLQFDFQFVIFRLQLKFFFILNSGK